MGSAVHKSTRLHNKKIDNAGTINKKPIQILAYADGVAIAARWRKEIESAFQITEGKSKDRGLTVNESKKKYM